MSDARQAIFEAIRRALPGENARETYPDYDPSVTVSAARLPAAASDLWQVFAANLRAVNGRFLDDPAALASLLGELGHTRGFCDPALDNTLGTPLRAAGLEVETTFDHARYEDYQFGITRATGAIAESGTIIIDDDLTCDRLAALAPWTHVAVIPTARLHATIADAVAALGASPNTIWCTGPSKTADVEGILIEGVHGPGEQIALRISR